MARASISFEDTAKGVLMTLNFDDELPADPEEASDAQVQALIAFQAFLSEAYEEGGELDSEASENGSFFDEEPQYGEQDLEGQWEDTPEV